MSIHDLIGPWSGIAYRHIPAASTIDVLNFRFAGQSPTNRWNVAGQPTLYLAGDYATVIGEFARHFDLPFDPGQGRDADARRIFRMGITIEHLLDLRDARAHEALSLTNAPFCFLERRVARATAAYIRQMTRAQALLVPSMAFLDEHERWVLVLFLEKLPADPRAFLVAEADRVFRPDSPNVPYP